MTVWNYNTTFLRKGRYGKIWEYTGEVSNRYTHIWPVLLSDIIDCNHLWVVHMGAHFTQAPVLSVFVLGRTEISISLDFT